MTTPEHDPIEVHLPPGPGGRGAFVTFEGGEGSGKSTQAGILARRSGALLTHQPGATDLGAELRRILLDGAVGELADRAETLLMAADRAQHAHEMLLPTLRSGRPVVCDRYIGSSIAYQGYGRGLDPEEVGRISDWAVDGLAPDLVVYLRTPPVEAAARTGGPRDRIEAAGGLFHQRVIDGFDAQAAADPIRWVVVDGSGTVEEVAHRVTEAIAQRLDPG